MAYRPNFVICDGGIMWIVVANAEHMITSVEHNDSS